MRRRFIVLAVVGLLCSALTAQGQSTAKKEVKAESATALSADCADADTAFKASPKTKYVPVDKYDPLRDADRDIKEAVAEAKRTNRRVLLEVGGLWCVWCRHMDAFFENQPNVLALREEFFVTLKINYDEEHKNVAVLSRYPKISGFPHIFVLDGDGKLLHSQDTGELEEGKGYNTDKFAEFLKVWAFAAPEQAEK